VSGTQRVSLETVERPVVSALEHDDSTLRREVPCKKI
jgi:hypothetical protein